MGAITQLLDLLPAGLKLHQVPLPWQVLLLVSPLVCPLRSRRGQCVGGFVVSSRLRPLWQVLLRISARLRAIVLKQWISLAPQLHNRTFKKPADWFPSRSTVVTLSNSLHPSRVLPKV